ncbi:MAG: hypothetical protein IOC92_05775 [Rhodobacter sp.]|nr:hypothetical protein [Rhodobacter sp.]MCA3461092.1 hypothetical protein [Rhodobacter sp.]MCA3464693.1 hypothetical protein [Rhodobacter sp.]MCA3466037.1 hypothetical protein [Rhodobacter sp.]MCA3471108.1 hypothetical protein [Rhodobacter sp.]
MIRHHSPLARAVYQDFLGSFGEGQLAALRGSPTLEERSGRRYWYDSYRVGDQVRKRYIGEDTPDLAQRMALHREDARRKKEGAGHRARLVRLLRAEGFLPIDGGTGAILNALAKTGVFRTGGTIVGTSAFRLYEGELGLRLGSDPAAGTDDADMARFERLSLALDDRVDASLPESFRDLEFSSGPGPNWAAVWKWKQTRSGTVIDFLTPSIRSGEGIRDLPALGVSARSLDFLDYLIADPIKAAVAYRSGVLVQVPRPERYAMHKLVVADRRQGGPDAPKSRKDRAQAAFLIAALARDRPEALRLAYEVAIGNGVTWRDRIAASLKRMPRTFSVLEAL